MDWAHLPHLPNAFSPLMSMRCRKTIARPGMARYRKLLLTSRPLLKTDAQDRCSRPLLKTAAPLLFAITKTRSSMPLGATAVVTDTLFSELYVIRVFSFYFSQLIAKVRPEEPCISAFRQQVLAVTNRTSSEQHGDTCLFPCFNEVQLAKQDRRMFDACYHARIKSTLWIRRLPQA